jgi:RsiW-degrading membrane proteinase PrsW (M82 family)
MWWLWYAYGGRLPGRYRDWVRRDTTAPTWMVRHIVRILVEALPVLVVAFVLLRLCTPVPAWGIVGALLTGVLLSLFYTIGTARNLIAVRLARHGFPPDVEPPPSRLIPDDAERR